ncbi:hypothetical protein Dimus_039269 [Dionaea muscipula]
MLRACALDWRGNWDDHLPLMEFSYNNSFHSSIEMTPYEALYGRKCRSPSCWVEVGERRILGPELVDEASRKIAMIGERLDTTRVGRRAMPTTDGGILSSKWVTRSSSRCLHGEARSDLDRRAS